MFLLLPTPFKNARFYQMLSMLNSSLHKHKLLVKPSGGRYSREYSY